MIDPGSSIIGCAITADERSNFMATQVTDLEGNSTTMGALLQPVSSPQTPWAAPYAIGDVLDASGKPQTIFAIPASTTLQDCADMLYGVATAAWSTFLHYNPAADVNFQTGVLTVPVLVVAPAGPGQPVLPPATIGL